MKTITTLSLVAFYIASVELNSIQCEPRHFAKAVADYRKHCHHGHQTTVANRVNTTDKLRRLRYRMRDTNAQGYIVSASDEHQSENVAEYDKRLEYMSGFSGSAGFAVITTNEAVLFVDDRYELQADDQLDCNWHLVISSDIPTDMFNWTVEHLSDGSFINADARFISQDMWLKLNGKLSRHGFRLSGQTYNLVDEIWNDATRPLKPNGPIYIHEEQFAGQTWSEKVTRIFHDMDHLGVQSLIVTSLDEICWLFNLRGSDNKFSPVFKSYALLTKNGIKLFASETKLTPKVQAHLQKGNSSIPSFNVRLKVDVIDYEQFFRSFSNEAKNRTNVGKILVPTESSFAVYSIISEHSRVVHQSPVSMRKMIKNEVEIRGMKSAQVKDAVALCDFMAHLEYDVVHGKSQWNEMKAAKSLSHYRKEQRENMGDSFDTISAVGPNAAIIHYVPRPETNRTIDTSRVYLLDSGGQYLDGTTDVTRTFHFGNPTNFEKEAYTRVLMGAIDMMMLKFPSGTKDIDISDLVARKHLHDIGLNYKHGTGHGIGAFLNVHEGPVGIGAKRGHKGGVTLKPGMFLTIEPGYYEPNSFGIRIENVVQVKETDTRYTFDGKTYLTFECVTFVPLEPNLMKTELLSNHHMRWISDYNTRIRSRIGKDMQLQKREMGLRWIYNKTASLQERICSNGDNRLDVSTTLIKYIATTFALSLYFS